MDTKENWLLCKLLQTLYSSNSHSAERTALYSTEKPKSKIQELVAQYKVSVPLSHLKSCFEAVFTCALHRLKLHLTTHTLSSCLPAEQSGFDFPVSARVEMRNLGCFTRMKLKMLMCFSTERSVTRDQKQTPHVQLTSYWVGEGWGEP